jgi:hypothetical protein
MRRKGLDIEKKKIWEKKRTLSIQQKSQKVRVVSLRGEVWKDIPGYEGLYQISSMARLKSLGKWVNGKHKGVKSFKKEKLLKYYIDPKWYPHTNLSKNGVKRSEFIHRLFALAFIPNPENKPQINHKNGKKDDIRVSNLEWSTQLENVTHMHQYGLANPSHGENHCHCKLTTKQVSEIRKKYVPFKYSQSRIAEEYGVSQSHICLILQRKHRRRD